jgi:3-(3-hydroxy-phenyl)propionate hydroxylase
VAGGSVRQHFVVRSNERVLIVGGGPVGTITGLKLVRDGIPVTIFDSLPEPAPDHRASTLQPSTLDLLEELDMLPRIHEQGLPSPVFQWRDIPTGEIVEFDYRILADECKHPYVIQLEQHRTIAAALEIAQRYADYELIRSVVVTAIRQSSAGVEADVQFPDGRIETFTGAYLIGCDGGRSMVRKTIGTTFDGFTWPERFNIIATPFDFAQLGFRFRNYCPHPERWVSLIKVPGEDFQGLWRCIFPAKSDETDEFVQSDAWIQARFLERFPEGAPYTVRHRNMYGVHQRVAGAFRQGRFALAGDSAHLNSPIGGVGMNSGIHDGLNLAAKLRQIWDGADADELLDRYDRQRRETAIAYVQAQTIANKRTLEENNPEARKRNFEELRRQANDPDLARDYARRGSLIAMWRTSEAIA